MCILKCTAIICLVLTLARAAKLPKYFGQCKRADPDLNACLTQSAIAGFPTFIKGDPEHHVIKMTPLHVNEMLINVQGNLIIKLTDIDLIGVETINIEKVSWDFDKKRFDLMMKFDMNALVGTYDINGKILILPITGHGPCNITYVNPVYKFYSEYEIEEKNQKEYVNIVKSGATYTLDRAYFGLNNLFNGNAVSGDEMLKFLDENWKEVNDEIGSKVGDALAQVLGTVLKNFFAVIPLRELFA